MLSGGEMHSPRQCPHDRTRPGHRGRQTILDRQPAVPPRGRRRVRPGAEDAREVHRDGSPDSSCHPGRRGYRHNASHLRSEDGQPRTVAAVSGWQRAHQGGTSGWHIRMARGGVGSCSTCRPVMIDVSVFPTMVGLQAQHAQQAGGCARPASMLASIAARTHTSGWACRSASDARPCVTRDSNSTYHPSCFA